MKIKLGMHRALGWQADLLIGVSAGAKAWSSPASSEWGEGNSPRDERSQNSCASSWRNNRGCVRESAVMLLRHIKKVVSGYVNWAQPAYTVRLVIFLYSVSNSIVYPVLNKLLKNLTLHSGGAVNPTSTRTRGVYYICWFSNMKFKCLV